VKLTQHNQVGLAPILAGVGHVLLNHEFLEFVFIHLFDLASLCTKMEPHLDCEVDILEITDRQAMQLLVP